MLVEDKVIVIDVIISFIKDDIIYDIVKFDVVVNVWVKLK